jgi:RHS repeat-associated protein
LPVLCSAGANLTNYALAAISTELHLVGLRRSLARYYDPNLGRFASEDRLHFKAGVNFYPYVKNSPVSFVDPSGLTCKPWDKCRKDVFLPCLDDADAADQNCRIGAGGWCSFRLASCTPLCYPKFEPQFCLSCLDAAAAACASAREGCRRQFEKNIKGCFDKLLSCVYKAGPGLPQQ